MKIIFLTFLFAFPVLAQDFTFNKEKGEAVPNFVGQINVARGKVFQMKGGVKKEVKVGARFYKNDTLITAASSFAQLLIADDSVITLGANTELNFADFKFQDKTNRQIVYSFIKGQIRGLIKNKAQEGDIVFKTKVAVMGIRGTELFVNHQKIKNLEISEFALLEGNTLVTDDKGLTHELNKTDRLIIVQNPDTKQSANEKNQLNEEQLKILNQENELMYLFDPTALNMASPLLPFFHTEKINEPAIDSTAATDSDASGKEVQNKGWKKNLDKLNQKLKDYQKD
jgi:hypothetical protein